MLLIIRVWLNTDQYPQIIGKHCEPSATFTAQSPLTNKLQITAHNLLEIARGWMDYVKCDYRHYLIIHENIWQRKRAWICFAKQSVFTSDVVERLTYTFVACEIRHLYNLEDLLYYQL